MLHQCNNWILPSPYVSMQIDVFAFAMTIYQLLTLYRPYELLLDIDSKIKCNDVVSRNERPAISGKVNSSVLLFFIHFFTNRESGLLI